MANYCHPSLLQILRFTNAVFGIIKSPFLLNGTIKGHLGSRKVKFQEQLKQLKEAEKNFFIDDIIIGGCTVDFIADSQSAEYLAGSTEGVFICNDARPSAFSAVEHKANDFLHIT